MSSLSVYFPATSKIKEAEDKGYQYTSVKGGGFVEKVESEENRQSAETLFYSEFYQYFVENKTSLELTATTNL